MDRKIIIALSVICLFVILKIIILIQQDDKEQQYHDFVKYIFHRVTRVTLLFVILPTATTTITETGQENYKYVMPLKIIIYNYVGPWTLATRKLGRIHMSKF